MFTGIVEEVGTVQALRPGSQSYILTVSAKKVLEDAKVGDSICTNGICLTVTALHNGCFDADVMPETVRRTNFASLRPGSRVNLERALTLSSRLGGHMVSGHIDGTGQITEMRKEDNAVWITVQTQPGLLRYMIEKGSIAIDGISLTLAQVTDTYFKVSVIPHTGEETILLGKHPGDTVNLECDQIGKYVDKLMHTDAGQPEKAGSGVSMKLLIENGFV